MRKEPIFTRSFTDKWATVLGFNTTTSETETRKFPVPKKLEDKKILDHIRKSLEKESNSDFVPVKLLETETKTEIRGITESKFRENSFHMPNRSNTNTNN